MDYHTDEGSDIALYVNDQLECMELCLEEDEAPAESLCVKIKRRAKTGDIIVWGSTTGHLTMKTE